MPTSMAGPGGHAAGTRSRGALDEQPTAPTATNCASAASAKVRANGEYCPGTPGGAAVPALSASAMGRLFPDLWVATQGATGRHWPRPNSSFIFSCEAHGVAQPRSRPRKATMSAAPRGGRPPIELVHKGHRARAP